MAAASTPAASAAPTDAGDVVMAGVTPRAAKTTTTTTRGGGGGGGRGTAVTLKALSKLLDAKLAPLLAKIDAIYEGLRAWQPDAFAATPGATAPVKATRPPTAKQLAWQEISRKYGVGRVPDDAPELAEYEAMYGPRKRKVVGVKAAAVAAAEAEAGDATSTPGGAPETTAAAAATPTQTGAGVAGVKRRRVAP